MSPRAWIPLRFQRRLVVAVAAVTVVTVGGALFIMARVVNASQQGQLDEALLAEARQEAGEAAALGGGQLNVSDRPGPAPDNLGHLTKYAAIYDGNRAVVAATPTFRDKPPPLEAIDHPAGQCFDTYLAREHVRGVVVAVPRHPRAILFLAAPRFDLDRDAAFLDRAALLVLVAAAIWATAVATWIVRRLTRGHQAIAAIARRVADGDLSARVSEATSDQEMVQLARDFNHMIDRLSALLSSQKHFVAHAAHELRSPLAVLYGELSFALRQPRDAETYRRAIEEALDSARHFKTMAEDLLTLARVGASSEDHEEKIDPRKIIEDSARTLAAEAAAHEVDLRIEGQCRSISGRPRDLERLFRNLLENAVRHSPKGGTVEARLAEQDGAVIVTLTDEGAGVAETDRERIFEPFYRGPGERAESLPGAGLGLAIARGIARSHGGDVVLHPKRNQGAQFVVRLSG